MVLVPNSDALVRRARAATGSDDLGNDGWQEGLERLLDAVKHDVTDQRAADAITDIVVKRLVQRLRIEAWRSEQESAPNAQVGGPIVILGLPRTGTTALHYLLSLDLQFQYLRSWEVNDPRPRSRSDEERDPRRSIGATRTDVRHIVSADGPAEDWPIHALAFDHAELTLPVPSYTAWWRERDHDGLFDNHERFLQIVQSTRTPKRWLLKMPAYIFLIEEMAAHYPTATFVMTHRDPIAAIASTCSVVADSRRKRIPSWSPDPEFGRMLLAHWMHGMASAITARARVGEGRFIDVGQPELGANPVGVAETVCRTAGLTLSPEAVGAMTAWGEDNRPGSRGAHLYSLAEYGLTEATVINGFAHYLERFGHLFNQPNQVD